MNGRSCNRSLPKKASQKLLYRWGKPKIIIPLTESRTRHPTAAVDSNAITPNDRELLRYPSCELLWSSKCLFEALIELQRRTLGLPREHFTTRVLLPEGTPAHCGAQRVRESSRGVSKLSSIPWAAQGYNMMPFDAIPDGSMSDGRSNQFNTA